MKKISVSNIVEFSRKTPNSQKTFVINLAKPKKENTSEEGGNYWIHSLSTIGNVFHSGNKELLNEKLDILVEKFENSTAKISKGMFKRNIEILHNFEDFDFLQLKPKYELKYLSKPHNKSILTIKDIPVQVLPHHVFVFEEGKVKKIGAIWFVAKLNGYKSNELAVFTDALYRYLEINYIKEYEISLDFCWAVDVMNLNKLSYKKLSINENPAFLNAILESIKVLSK